MLKILNDVEIKYLDELYQINTSQLFSLFKQYESNVYQLVENDLEIKSVYQSTSSYLKRINVQTTEKSSLIYYMNCEKELNNDIRGLKNNSNNSRPIIDKYKVLVLHLYGAFYNLIFSLMEDIKKDDGIVAIFESLPLDLPQFDSLTEAIKLRNIFNGDDSLYKPIVRFNTNHNTFKNLCSNYTLSILHMICHGEGNGDLALMGSHDTTKYLGIDTFVRFFNEKYNNGSIDMVYFNSCYSSKFAEKLMNKCNKFNNSISHIGINENNYAISFSLSYYEKVYNTCNYKVSFDEVVENFSFKNKERENYASNMLFLNLTFE